MRDLVLYGSCLIRLKEIPDGSVQTCVTSPPYFGLRDYGVPGQIGLEATPAEYVDRLVEVFREVRRVLRDDGTLWLNLGDSYARGRTGRYDGGRLSSDPENWKDPVPKQRTARGIPDGLKDKDLIGIPWRVAFALQADGWWLRSDIIWAKNNAMPESVTDRPTKSHEYVFLLSKSPEYFYDQDAIREPHTMTPQRRLSPVEERESFGQRQVHTEAGYRNSRKVGVDGHPNGRNKRTVWSINPKPYKGAHFAVFPAELPALCIKAGTSQKGACGTCGAPWRRVLERMGDRENREGVSHGIAPENRAGGTREKAPTGSGGGNLLASVPRAFVGWEPSCACGDREVVPCVVLDPFAGSGTTLEVAKSLDRDFLGIELNEGYRPLIERRIGPALDAAQQRGNIQFLLSLEEARD